MARKSHKRRTSKRGRRPCRGRNRSAARKSRRCRTSRKGYRGFKRKGSKRRSLKRSYSKRGRRGSHKASRRGRKLSRRNPGMERTLSDGSTVTLDEYGSDQGIVRIHYASGGMRDYKLPWTKALKRYYAIKSGTGARKHAAKEDWALLAMDNPRRGRRKGRRGMRTKRNCGMTQDPRYATTRIIRRGGKSHNPRRIYRPRGRNSWRYNPDQFPVPYQSGLNPRGRRGRKSRRNPAQFPMPFASGLNPRISRKEARGMGRVLRRHGYKRCKV